MNIWNEIQKEVKLRIKAEPSLEPYLNQLILSQDNLINSVASVLASKLNNIKDFSKKDTDLLNYILFNKESKDFYLSSNKNTYNDIVGLQEGFGLYIE